MDQSKTLTLRVSNHWLSTVGQLLNVLSGRQKMDRSKYIRHLVERDEILWLSCPYIARDSNHFIYVDREGNVYYRAVQSLELNTPRHKLPASIEMKSEKQIFYGDLYGSEVGNRIKRHWMINYFSAWQGTTDQKLLVDHVDRHGIFGKTADLQIDSPKDILVTREVLVVLRDYVQRRGEGDSTDDRGDIPIDIPTLNLDLRIMVDTELYSKDDPVSEVAAVGYEIRNRESARFQQEQFGNQILFSKHRCPQDHPTTQYEEGRHAVGEAFSALKKRITELSSVDRLARDGKPVVDDPDNRKALSQLKKPQRYLFGNLSWDIPYQGFEVCLTWNKPALESSI